MPGVLTPPQTPPQHSKSSSSFQPQHTWPAGTLVGSQQLCGASLTSLASFPTSFPFLSVPLPGSCQLRICQFRVMPDTSMLVIRETEVLKVSQGRHFPWSLIELARPFFLSWLLQNRNCTYTLRCFQPVGILLLYEDVRAESENKAAKGPPKSWGALSGTPLHTCTYVCAYTCTAAWSKEPTACTATRMQSQHRSQRHHVQAVSLPGRVRQSLHRTHRLSVVSPSQQNPQPPPFHTVSSHPYCHLPKGEKGKQFTDIISCSAMWILPLSCHSCLPNTAAKIAPALRPNQKREEFKKKKKNHVKILLDSKTHNALGPHLINLQPLMSTASKAGVVHSQTHSRRVNMIWCWHRPITVTGSSFQFMDAVKFWQYDCYNVWSDFDNKQAERG